MSPSNILLGRDLEEQLPAPTDVSKVRKQAMTENFADVPKVRKQAMSRSILDKRACSLPNLNVKNIAKNFAEFNSKGAQSLTNLTDPRWREKSGIVVGKLDFKNYLAKVEDERKMARGYNRISTSAVYTFDGESKKADGGDRRKGGDGRD